MIPPDIVNLIDVIIISNENRTGKGATGNGPE